MTASTAAPSNAPQPQALRRASPSARSSAAQVTASTKGYYYVTFSVTKTTDASLLTGMTTSGEVPLAAQTLGAELDDITTTGQMLETMTCKPGSSSIACTGATGTTQLNPSHKYLIQFTASTPTIALTLMNKSGISPAYFYIVGNNAVDRDDPKFYRLTPSGQLVPMMLSDLSNGFADYEIPFTEEGTTLQLPLVRSGRIYISLGKKLLVQLNAGNEANPALWVAPAPWSNSTDPSVNTLFDWVEFDYSVNTDTNVPGMGVNKTEVQMYGLPIQMSLTSANGSKQTTGSLPGTREKLFSEIEANPTFASLVQAGSDPAIPARIISPDNGLYNSAHNIPGVPTFDQTYLQQYITEVWQKYATQTLTMYTSAYGTYTGNVNSQNVLVFTPPSNGVDKTVWNFNMPTTSDAIVGNGALTDPCYASGVSSTAQPICLEIASAMSAAFNRSTLLVYPVITRDYTNGSCMVNLYYANSPTNVYSHLIHEDSLPTANAPDGAAYGFGFDDNCNQSSFIADNSNPPSLLITVEPF